MLRSANEVMGYSLMATDGDIGKVDDFLFDSEEWRISHLVADTGKWLPGRLVLISPHSLLEPEWSDKRLPVSLTKEQIEKSPGIEADRPVSRQRLAELDTYYGWPGGAAVSGFAGPTALPTPKEEMALGEEDPNLRSAREVAGYHIQARDGEIGHVEDFILGTDVWAFRYLVIDTRNWLPGRKVLVFPKLIQSISWSDRAVELSLERREVKESPEFDPNAPVNREYETRLYDYYGRPKYWT